VKKRETTLGAFPEIERAFDCTSFDITEAAKRQGVADRIDSLLGGRKKTAEIAHL
jgi:hypothetical protein